MSLLFHQKKTLEEAEAAAKKLQSLGYETSIKEEKQSFNVYGKMVVRDPSFEGLVKKLNKKGVGDQYPYMKRVIFHG